MILHVLLRAVTMTISLFVCINGVTVPHSDVLPWGFCSDAVQPPGDNHCDASDGERQRPKPE